MNDIIKELEGGYIELNYLANELTVSRDTVMRWFKKEKEFYKGHVICDFEVVFNFLLEHRNGKYMFELGECCEEDFENMDENNISILFNTILSKICMVIKDESRTAMDDPEIYGHIYQLNIMPL